jgi:hypothetical protein
MHPLCLDLPQRKIVIQLQMKSDRCRSKAMALVAATGGVHSVALDGQGRDKVVVVGEGIDPVKPTCALRKKVGAADLLQVGEANPPAAVPSVPPPQPVNNIVHYHPAGYSLQWHGN